MRLERWSDLNSGLVKFRARGLTQAVIQKHCAGDEVKFYAVKGGRRFWPYYPKDSEGYPFDKKSCRLWPSMRPPRSIFPFTAATPSFHLKEPLPLIDLNDWPSFRPLPGRRRQRDRPLLKGNLRCHPKPPRNSPSVNRHPLRPLAGEPWIPDNETREVTTSWPGPKSVALFDEEQKYIAPGNQSIALLSKLAIEKGEGCTITDADGNEYLDFNVGVSVASLGYTRPGLSKR